MRLCQVLKNNSTPDEWNEMFAFVMETVGVALASGDAKEDAFTVDWLVGTRTKAGFCQSTITKRKFIKWFVDEHMHNAASGAGSVVSLGGAAAAKATFDSPKTFFYKFAKSRPADEENVTLLELAADSVKAFIASDMQFKSDAEKAAADLLSKVLMNQFEEEFTALAFNGTSFAQYFGGGIDVEGSGLLDGFEAFKNALVDVPVSVAPASPGSGGGFVLIPGDEDSEFKSKLYNKVVARRKEKLRFFRFLTGSWTSSKRAARPVTFGRGRSSFRRKANQVNSTGSYF
jgi:hypothetical protein